MSDTALNAGFLTDLHQHWPFPSLLTDCTLITACFNEQALNTELCTHYGVTPPPAARKRQAEFLAARLCARQALQQQTGRACLPTQQSDSRIPIWPPHSCGSMTHSQGICAALVGNSRTWQSLGLDLERPIPHARAQRLARTILTNDEYAAYCELDTAQQAQRLTLTFSLKESLFKALNPLTGMYFGFQDAQIIAIDSASAGLARLVLNKSLSKQWRAGCELEGQFSLLHGSVLSLIAVGY